MIKFSPRFLSAIILLIAGAILWLMISNVTFSFFIRAYTDYFAWGLSEFKSRFVWMWCIVCSAWVLLFNHSNPRTSLYSKYWLSLFGAYAVGLFIHISFCLRIGVPINETVYVYIQGEESSSHLNHIHATKGILWYLIDALNLGEIQRYADPGRFYAETLSFWYYIPLALLILINAIIALEIFRSNIKLWLSKKDFFKIIIFLFSSGTALRTTIDGGIFDCHAVACFIVLSILLNENSWVVSCKKYLMIFLYSSIILYCASLYSNAPNISILMLNYILVFFAFAFTAVFFKALTDSNNRINYLILAILIGAFTFLASGNTYWRWAYRTYTQPLKKDSTIWLSTSSENVIADRTIFEQSWFKVLEKDIKNDTNVLSLLPEILKKGTYLEFSIPYVTCDPTHGYKREVALRLFDTHLLPAAITTSMHEEFKISKPLPTCQYDLVIEATVKGCIPQTVDSSIASVISGLGIERFAIIPENPKECRA